MEKREKLEAMDKMLRILEDLHNSETSVLKKVSQIEADNINIGIGLLDQTIPDVYENVNNTIEKIDEIMTQFTAHRNKFAKDNKLEEPETESSGA